MSDIRKDECGGAVQNKEQHKQCVYTASDVRLQMQPEPCKEICQKADPEYTCNAKSHGRIETDIAVVIKRVAAVIPVAQIPYRIKKPSDCKFQSGANEQREKENEDRVLFHAVGEAAPRQWA